MWPHQLSDDAKDRRLGWGDALGQPQFNTAKVGKMGCDTAAQAETIDWFARHRHGLPQDRARLLFHRAAMAGSPQTQLAFGAIVEIADG